MLAAEPAGAQAAATGLCPALLLSLQMKEPLAAWLGLLQQMDEPLLQEGLACPACGCL